MALPAIIARLNASLQFIVVQYKKDDDPIEIVKTEEVTLLGFMKEYSVGQGYKAYALRLEFYFRDPVVLVHLGVLQMDPRHEIYRTDPIQPDKRRPRTYFVYSKGLGPNLMLEIVD
jgi:hypothetical protein